MQKCAEIIQETLKRTFSVSSYDERTQARRATENNVCMTTWAERAVVVTSASSGEQEESMLYPKNCKTRRKQDVISQRHFLSSLLSKISIIKSFKKPN